jgi:hypothetical protein
MMRPVLLGALVAVVAALSGCGEKPQSLSGVKTDVPAYQGADNKFVAPGWKPGDKNSWEQDLKTRALNTQNEYSRITK